MKATRNPLNKKRVAYIAIGWVIISCIQVTYDYLVVLNFSKLDIDYPYWQLILTNGIIALIAGIITGTFLMRIEPWVRRQPFWKAILSIFSVYTVLSIFLIGAGSFFYQILTKNNSPLSEEVWQEVVQFMVGADFLKHFLSWATILLGTIITIAVADKYGQGNFRNMLFGRYFQPQEEFFIFMFLDLKGATTIAEQLGAKKYFNFLQDFVTDATLPILQTKGAIYQYVGDEIIVTWSMKKGVKNANCINCFFKIQEAIQSRRRYYIQQYQCVPSFKAGLHCGQVIAGEIGLVKKDITFSGDVLNTASRIQNECNKHGVLLLLSNDLLQLLSLPTSLQSKPIGKIELRGKQERVQLYTILEE